MAPPSKVTAIVIEDLRAAFEAGATLREAASAAGVSVRTLHRWVKRGFRSDASYEHWIVRKIVHEALRGNGVRLVQTKDGIALRRRPARRLTAATLLRMLEKKGTEPT